MYTTGQFGYETPEALQRTMWWHMTVLFGHRGRQESRQMCWGDVLLKRDDKGEEDLEFQERLTKARSGGSTSVSRSSAPKAWKNAENPERCPVECYKRFVGHRSQERVRLSSAACLPKIGFCACAGTPSAQERRSWPKPNSYDKTRLQLATNHCFMSCHR